MTERTEHLENNISDKDSAAPKKRETRAERIARMEKTVKELKVAENTKQRKERDRNLVLVGVSAETIGLPIEKEKRNFLIGAMIFLKDYVEKNPNTYPDFEKSGKDFLSKKSEKKGSAKT